MDQIRGLLMDASTEIKWLTTERDERAQWAEAWHRGLEAVATILDVPSVDSDKMLLQNISAAIEKLRQGPQPSVKP